MLDFVQRMWRDARGYAALSEGVPEPDRAVGTVGEQTLRGRQGLDQGDGTLVIAGLTFGKVKQQRPAPAIAHQVELGGQPAAAASDTSG